MFLCVTGLTLYLTEFKNVVMFSKIQEVSIHTEDFAKEKLQYSIDLQILQHLLDD